MVEIVDSSVIESDLDLDNVPERYRTFRDGENVPVHTGLSVSNINELEVDSWDRTGQYGAIVNLYGAEGLVDHHVHEIRPTAETETQCHFYDELVYVTQGSGMTVIGEGEDEQRFEWEEQAMFHIPNNTPYRHVNLSDEDPVRLVAQTGLPHFLQMIPFEKFFEDVEYDFWDELEEDFYAADGQMYEGDDFPVVWEANFIPNIRKFDQLEDFDHRGAGGTSVKLSMPNSSMWSHISEFPVGTYKKAHRHNPGATVTVLSGTGYSLMWRENWDRIAKIDWEPLSMFVPPSRWFHQHFNAGEEPARYFAMHNPKIGTTLQTPAFNPFIAENQIEYTEEAEIIRDTYDAELQERGLESRMPPECYSDPDFIFR